MDAGQIVNLLTGAGVGGVVLKLIDVYASRRSSKAQTEATQAQAEVTLSGEARQWVETFRSEIAAMQIRHREELGALSARHKADVDDMRARIDSMEGSIADKDKRIALLEHENSGLEAKVRRLQARVLELERGITPPR